MAREADSAAASGIAVPRVVFRVRRAKSVPPELPFGCLARPRLGERLDELFGRRLALVVAGAGFGKSTLLAHWSADIDCVWYSLGPEDADLQTLARGLAEAVRVRIPDLPLGPIDAAPAAQSESDAREQADALAAHLCGALENFLEHDVVLVLDDAHELEAAAASIRLIESLVRQAPATVHTVLASRKELPFAIDRIRGRGQVVEIVAPELAFDESEIRQFVAAELGHVEAELIGLLAEVTDGWPAAVRLALEALRRRPPNERRSTLAQLREPGGSLFTYLAVEVFGQESTAVRQLIRSVAPFDRFTVDLCEALGASGAAAALVSLTRRGLFVRPVSQDGCWFVLHALVREFVLANLEPGELRRFHELAGRWFEEQDLLEEALDSYAAAAAHADVARLLIRHGIAMGDQGRVGAVGRALASLPTELIDGRLEEIRSMVEWARGNLDEALACMRRSIGGSQSISASQAWLLCAIHRRRGRQDLALRALRRARLEGSEPSYEALVVGYLARSHYALGQSEKCRQFAVEAYERATELGDLHALANAHMALALLAKLDTDMGAEDSHSLRAAELAENSQHLYLATGIRINRAYFKLQRGLYQDALEEADRALHLSDLSAERPARAAALVVRGQAERGLGRLDEALAELEAAKPHPGCETDWFIALGDVYRDRGDLPSARLGYERAVAAASRSQSRQDLVDALAGLGRVLVRDEPQEARRVIGRALALGPGPRYADAALAAGWIALASGDAEEARRWSTEAATEGRRSERRALLAEALELDAACSVDARERASRLEEARALWSDLGAQLGKARVELALAQLSHEPGRLAATARAERRLRRLGVHLGIGARPGVLGFLPEAKAPPLHVRCLGSFEVTRAGALVSWRSKKARDLLKILIARRSSPAPRELLMDLLWPGEAPSKASNRLSVVLSTLRATLDPTKRFPPGQFVSVRPGAVRLQPDSLESDVESFICEATIGLALLREGRASEGAEALEYAASLYTGDFLTEDWYEDWSVPMREEARALYVAVARKLVELAKAREDHEAAARYLLQILARDPYDEEAHLDRVQQLTSASRHGEARRAYRLYVGCMEEIGVEPAQFQAISSRAA